MAQTYQMKHNPQGTIYSLLTVESDGQMTMTFHGTDREISHEVTENADGWLCYPGGMFPGLESGKWNKMEDGRGMMDDDCNATLSEREPLTMNPKPLTMNQPRPRRQHNPRKPHAEHQPSALSQPPSNPPRGKKGSLPREGWGGVTLVSNQTSDTMKAIGMVAAATVALFVIYETGLLIPLGLIGLATGGVLK